ncbi:MAG: zinc-binding dehydrogenase [Sedimentisphaerales bacterium]|jgi:NADPH:quinone reductase-like Zn-dependent oxidoreductase
MKAAVITEHGELDKVNLADIAQPKPSRGEVLIQVKSAALNHLDIWVRKGRPGVTLSGPHILGSDAAGVVSEMGAGADGFAVGDEVIINPGLGCGKCELCRKGEQSECVSFGIVGMSRPGTFAEYVSVPVANVYRKPAHLSFDEAAALPLSYVTAWRMLMTRAGLRPGDTVLIHGIGGGAALAALQWAKLAGAVVIVTSSSDEKLKRAEQIGADFIINYNRRDVAGSVKEVTLGRGVDVAIDTVGAATWPVDFAVVRRGGKIVLCGVTSGPKADTNLQALYWNQLTIMGSTMGSDDDFRSMLAAASAGKLKPVIDSVFPLGKVRDAMGKMERGAQFGKIVLKVAE